MNDSLAIQILAEDEITPETVRALTSLATARIPKEMISEHPGKGGRKFQYVKHTHATRVMLESGLLWDFKADVGNAMVFDDRSAAVPCTLTVRIQLRTGEWLERSVTEVGAFEDGGAGMPSAMMVASAASRGLPRCMMRMFGWGIELYPDSETPPVGWWRALTGLARKYKVDPKLLRDQLKEEGFSEDDLGPKFDEIVGIIKDLADYKEEKVL